MPKGILFWVIFVVAVILYGFLNWPFSRTTWGGFIIFALIALLGWQVFGPVVQ